MHLNQLKQAVIKGDMPGAKSLTQKAIEAGIEPARILNEALVAGMDEVGELFKASEIYVPEVLLAAKSMQEAMQLLKPLLVRDGIQPRGKIVVGTVRGDLHDIGKNLVAMMLEGAGFEIIDLGNDVPPERFVKAAAEHGATIIGMSALLTTTMYAMRDTIDLLKAERLDGKIKTMIGGAPVTQSFADEIGASGYGEDAATAVDLAKRFVDEQ